MPQPLERLVDGKDHTHYQGYSVHQEAGKFAVNYIGHHPERAQDTRMIALLKDLQAGASWGVLSLLDGPAEGDLQDPLKPQTKEAYEARRKEAREWTAANFTTPELNDLMDTTIDLALNPPTIKGKPGFIRGHSLLLRHMVDKPGSIFANGVTKEGKVRLVNGAFWEELGDANAPGYLEDILTNHASDLNPEFAAKKGLELYQRNKQEVPTREINMQYFSTQALDNYLEFVRKLSNPENRDNIAPDIIDELLTPYLMAILSPDPDDSWEFRFGEKYDIDKDTITRPANDLNLRLKDPLVQESLSRSSDNRDAVAAELGFDITNPSFNFTAALELINVIGGKPGEQILEKIIADKKSDYEVGKLAYAMSQIPSFRNRSTELFNGAPQGN